MTRLWVSGSDRSIVTVVIVSLNSRCLIKIISSVTKVIKGAMMSHINKIFNMVGERKVLKSMNGIANVISEIKKKIIRSFKCLLVSFLKLIAKNIDTRPPVITSKAGMIKSFNAHTVPVITVRIGNIKEYMYFLRSMLSPF